MCSLSRVRPRASGADLAILGGRAHTRIIKILEICLFYLFFFFLNKDESSIGAVLNNENKKNLTNKNNTTVLW